MRKIPRGRVSTYGTIARLAGLPRQARLVGYALHTLGPGSAVPWHRVINAAGRIALGDSSGAATTQQLRLVAEGVIVAPGGRVSLKRFGWPAVTAVLLRVTARADGVQSAGSTNEV